MITKIDFLFALFILTILYPLASAEECWPKYDKKKTCPTQPAYLNIPVLSGVYCYNDGSGNCKGFAGRFEFMFNTFTDTIIGPAPSSTYVDSSGYHQRVPVSYNIKGEINYADKGINWATKIAKTLAESPKSLLSATDFNWCQYTANDWWPYKSAILDPTRRYHIYFFNRQSCIYDTQAEDKTKAFQHFNTRFLHKSQLRLDLDMNPTIFVMEDHLVKDNNTRFRLVKHKRQHWYEVPFKVTKPTSRVRYFIEMGDKEQLPSYINPAHTVLLSTKAYENYTSICLKDPIRQQDLYGDNNQLFQPYCGNEFMEIADLPKPLWEVKKELPVVIEAGLHNLPRHPKIAENFYGIKINNDDDWSKFAKDGVVFTATTTIPIDSKSVKVISLYAEFGVNKPDKMEEYYPTPYIAEYKSVFRYDSRDIYLSDWQFDRDRATKKKVTNLNYVDDIAYLPKCKTILMIFGPLYSEVPADKFALETKAPIDSIYKLSVWEPTQAFFAMPEESDPTLWFYHRTNYVTHHTYTCGGPNQLVTAKKKDGKYYPLAYRQNLHNPPLATIISGVGDSYSEEMFFKDHGVFKGSLSSPEAPDPALFPLPDGDIEGPLKGKDQSWLWWVVAAGILIMVALCVICMIALRQRRKRRRGLDGRTVRSSQLGSRSHLSPSQRSALSSRGSGLHKGTQRSGLSRSSRSPSPSQRSGLSSSRPSSVSKKATARSGMSSRHSTTPSRATTRSGLSGRTSGARPSSSSSAKTGRSSASSRSSRASKPH